MSTSLDSNDKSDMLKVDALIRLQVLAKRRSQVSIVTDTLRLLTAHRCRQLYDRHVRQLELLVDFISKEFVHSLDNADKVMISKILQQAGEIALEDDTVSKVLVKLTLTLW